MKSISSAVLLVLLCYVSITKAQKLPNLQAVGVRLPANVKIDGKATEWDYTFQAHNNATNLSYTIANDDETLYLVLQATDTYVINTIVGYGFTFDIYKSGKKNDKDKISIQYPVYNSKNAIHNLLTAKKSNAIPDTSINIANAYMNTYNKALQKLNTIVVKGIDGLDTLSIYNDVGIKASGQFDNKKIYTLEMSVPLKLLKLSANNAQQFSYHMIINGYQPPEHVNIGAPPGGMNMAANMNVQPISNAEMEQAIAELNSRLTQRDAHTDCWGEYTLAKKQ